MSSPLITIILIFFTLVVKVFLENPKVQPFATVVLPSSDEKVHET